MPRDEKGNFHMSGLKPVDGKLPVQGFSKPAGGVEGGIANNPIKITTLHDHGDGTFHTEGDERMEHPDIGHALTHIGSVHAEGKHFHVHHDGLSMHSHGTNEAGEHEGTHDHENIEELKDSMAQFLDEEAEEGQNGAEDGSEYDEEENGGQLRGFNG